MWPLLKKNIKTFLHRVNFCCLSKNKMDQDDHAAFYAPIDAEVGDARKKPHCSYCKNHDKDKTTRQHTCPYKNKCKCSLCKLTQKAQTIMRNQQRVWRFMNQKNDNTDSTRYQKCDNCRNHQKFERKSNHNCPYENCLCIYCDLTKKRRQIMKVIQRARRMKVTLESSCDIEGNENLERMDEKDDVLVNIEEYNKNSVLRKEVESLLSYDLPLMQFIDKKNALHEKNGFVTEKGRIVLKKKLSNDLSFTEKKSKNGYSYDLPIQQLNSSFCENSRTNSLIVPPPNQRDLTDIPQLIRLKQFIDVDDHHNHQTDLEKHLKNLQKQRDTAPMLQASADPNINLIRIKMDPISPSSTMEVAEQMNMSPKSGDDVDNEISCTDTYENADDDKSTINIENSRIMYPTFLSRQTGFPLLTSENAAARNAYERLNAYNGSFPPLSYPPSVWGATNPPEFSPPSRSHAGIDLPLVRQPVRPKPILPSNLPSLWPNLPVSDLCHLNFQWLVYANDYYRNFNRSARQLIPQKVPNLFGPVSNQLGLPNENLRNGLASWFIQSKD